MFILVKCYKEVEQDKGKQYPLNYIYHMRVNGEHTKNASFTHVCGGLDQSKDSFLGAEF